jgi:hypothetical protein
MIWWMRSTILEGWVSSEALDLKAASAKAGSKTDRARCSCRNLIRSQRLLKILFVGILGDRESLNMTKFFGHPGALVLPGKDQGIVVVLGLNEPAVLQLAYQLSEIVREHVALLRVSFGILDTACQHETVTGGVRRVTDDVDGEVGKGNVVNGRIRDLASRIHLGVDFAGEEHVLEREVLGAPCKAVRRVLVVVLADAPVLVKVILELLGARLTDGIDLGWPLLPLAVEIDDIRDRPPVNAGGDETPKEIVVAGAVRKVGGEFGNGDDLILWQTEIPGWGLAAEDVGTVFLTR